MPIPTLTIHPGTCDFKNGSAIHFSIVDLFKKILRICASLAGTLSPTPSSSSESSESESDSPRCPPRRRAGALFSRVGKIPSSPSSSSDPEPYSSESSSSSSSSLPPAPTRRSFFRAMSASALLFEVPPLACSSPATRLDLRPVSASASLCLNRLPPPPPGASLCFFSRAISMIRFRSSVCALTSLRSASNSSRSSSVIFDNASRSVSSPIRSSPKPSPHGSFGSG
mmetsp:Transcript_9651/g.31915  ORF Transcript_9651/g.31915 Transcript_9651/m.31915 type:complete len:226 (+) Transcript_9651:1141-1818(+)